MGLDRQRLAHLRAQARAHVLFGLRTAMEAGNETVRMTPRSVSSPVTTYASSLPSAFRRSSARRATPADRREAAR